MIIILSLIIFTSPSFNYKSLLSTRPFSCHNKHLEKNIKCVAFLEQFMNYCSFEENGTYKKIFTCKFHVPKPSFKYLYFSTICILYVETIILFSHDVFVLLVLSP